MRPYRVGMSCAFCHVGPNPVKPPADPENPKWENLSSNVGAQYFWVDRIFNWKTDAVELHVPAVPHLAARRARHLARLHRQHQQPAHDERDLQLWARAWSSRKRWGKETLAGGEPNNNQFNDYVKDRAADRSSSRSRTRCGRRACSRTASDSVGALGALNRVYLNIGLFSEEWLLHFNALVGGKPITPIEIAVARKNSTYWQATEAQTPDMALSS